MLHHYVYYSYEEWGRGYIGVRSCRCLPSEDIKYFGSFKDKSFKPSNKIIIEVFDTREDANKAEILLHSFYEVSLNPHFANLAKSINHGFCPLGLKASEERKQKLRELRSGSKMSEETKLKIASSMCGKPCTDQKRHKLSLLHLGKRKSLEHRRKISKTLTGRKMPEEVKEKIRSSRKGYRHSTETIEKIRRSNKGKKRTEEQILQNRLRQKSSPVCLVNLHTGDIVSFVSQSEAARYLNVSPASINSLVKDRSKTCKGFKLFKD